MKHYIRWFLQWG